jgi:hypothetical protein
MAQQVRTVPVSIEEVMSSPAFALGAVDARAGAAHHPDFDSWHMNAQWYYERGRAWAMLTPRNVPLKDANGKVTANRMVSPPRG